MSENLVPVENGVITIRDLWDLKTSRRVGFNLFGNNLNTNKENAERALSFVNESSSTAKFKFIENSSNEAEHFSLGATITCEMLGGLIKITGGFDFAVGCSRGNSTQLWQIVCSDSRGTVMLKPGTAQTQYMDPHLEKLLENGNDRLLKNATHVVTEITLGGALTSSIAITQTKKGDKYKLGFNVAGPVQLILLPGKIGVSASVGEEVKITNYDCTTKVNSMPPLSFTPTGIEDFVPTEEMSEDAIEKNDDRVTVDFITQLNALDNEFPYWKDAAGFKLVGVPIKFKLQPIHTVVDIVEKDILNSDNLSAEDTLSSFSTQLFSMRDLGGRDSIKRQMLKLQPRILKVLDDSSLELTEGIENEQTSLEKDIAGKRLEVLTSYIEFRNLFYSTTSSKEDQDNALEEFSAEINRLVEWMDSKTQSTTDFVEMKTTEAVELTLATIVVEGNDEDEQEEEDAFEERSPLIYFSNKMELQFWAKSQRFCKLLYASYPLTNSGEDEKNKLRAIRQKIYNMSHLCGSLSIQPGFAYPMGNSPEDVTPTPLLSLSSPWGSIEFGRSEPDNILKFLTLLATLANFSKESGTFLPQITHLYQTYCELHGIALKLNNTVDLIPLIKLIEEVFGALEIFSTALATRAAIATKRDKTIIITQDGSQSSRDTLYTLLHLQAFFKEAQEEVVGVISGTFDERMMDDAPPIFLSWDGTLKAVCLDHLDNLILLHFLEEEGVGKWDKIEEILGERFENGFICSISRVTFAKRAFIGIGRQREDVEREDEEDEEVVEEKRENACKTLLELATKYLNQGQDGPVPFLNIFASYLVSLVLEPQGLFHPEDFSNLFDKREGELFGKFTMDDVGDMKWTDLQGSLATFWGKKGHQYQYYETLLSLAQAMEMYPSKPEDPAEEDLPEPYQLIQTEILDKYQVSKRFSAEIEAIHKMGLEEYETGGLMYAGVCWKEACALENTTLAYKGIALLKLFVDSIIDSGGVPLHLHQEGLWCTLENLPHYSPILYDQEVMWRIQRDLGKRKFYHATSQMLMNSPWLYPVGDLSKFEVELTRLTSLKDWWNVIRLIERMTGSGGGEEEPFEEEAIERIWRNPKFLARVRAYVPVLSVRPSGYDNSRTR